MKLQKQISRKTKGKTYSKWIITIPPKIVKKLDWKEGEHVETFISEKKLVLTASKSPIKKKMKIKKIIKGKKKMSSYEKFMNVYFNLPISERSQVIVVIDNIEITWEVAYKEIKNKTPLGKKIEKKLIELKII